MRPIHATHRGDPIEGGKIVQKVRLQEFNKDYWLYSLSELERNILEAILDHYPVLDPGYQQISRYMEQDATKEPQELLQECMSDRQKENRNFVQKLLMPTSQILSETSENSWSLQLNPDERESLLQILNDIRVGFWLELGSPEGSSPPESANLTPEEESKWALFQFTGFFQSNLLFDPSIHGDPDDENAEYSDEPDDFD